MNMKNLKDRVKDGTLDLSLSDLKEVPVREIAAVKKVIHLDLSNNLLASLPSTFVCLKQIVKLDLSKNMLTEIPENFGELRQLKHLDLYANQISRLPLSLGELKQLRWLDLKENPLTPTVASVAGPCSNLSECQACARNVVSYLSSVKVTIDEERVRRLNAIAADKETDTALPKKAGKKKKKKSADKDAKQSSDKNGSNSVRKISDVGKNENEKENLTPTPNHKHANKKDVSKGTACRSLTSAILWLFVLSLAFALMILTLPLYSTQSAEPFVDYIEMNTGVPLKAFQKHGIDMLHSSLEITSTWTKSICDNLKYAYRMNFPTNTSVPVGN